MHPGMSLPRALPVGLLAVVLGVAPASAFQPATTALSASGNDTVTGTDLVARGGDVVVSADRVGSGERMVDVASSTDLGVTWTHDVVNNQAGAARESQATICDGAAYMAYTTPDALPATDWYLRTYSRDLHVALMGFRTWTMSGVARKPDIACVANTNVVVAWFQSSGGGYHVKVRQQQLDAEFGYSQGFDLGSGTVSRGLAIATTSSRVYVAYFHGDELRVRRFSIAHGGHHALTAVGTTTVATLAHGSDPRIDGDGSRVILAYMDKASLQVRRSTDTGASFGRARTLRSEAFPGGTTTRPMTVAVTGSRIAIGALEVGNGSGTGLGYLSTNGGSSFAKVSQHPTGRVLAGLLKVGSSYVYAEAWDQSISQPVSPVVGFRRQ